VPFQVICREGSCRALSTVSRQAHCQVPLSDQLSGAVSADCRVLSGACLTGEVLWCCRVLSELSVLRLSDAVGAVRAVSVLLLSDVGPVLSGHRRCQVVLLGCCQALTLTSHTYDTIKRTQLPPSYGVITPAAAAAWGAQMAACRRRPRRRHRRRRPTPPRRRRHIL